MLAVALHPSWRVQDFLYFDHKTNIVRGDRQMADNQLLASLLTVALNSIKPRAASKRAGAQEWGDVWNDYNKFLKKLEKTDGSIDKRGINPD
jgi:hypothetical protein